MIVTNHSVVRDYLLGEGVAANPAGADDIHFRNVYRAYHDGRALPVHVVKFPPQNNASLLNPLPRVIRNGAELSPGYEEVLLKFSATPGDTRVQLNTATSPGYTLKYRYQTEDMELTDAASVPSNGWVPGLTNDKEYTFFLIAEEDNGTNRFYATLAVTPSTTDTTEVNGQAVVALPDNLWVPLDQWYRGFVVEFPDAETQQAPLRVENYTTQTTTVLPANSILLRSPDDNFSYSKYSMREYRFFDGSQTSPYPGLAFMRFAVKYDGEVRADVQGFALEKPQDCIREILRNPTWGANEQQSINLPGEHDPKPPATVKLGLSLGTATNAYAVLEQIARVRQFHLFRRSDGIYITFPEGLTPSNHLLPALSRCASPPPTCEYLSQAERATRLAVKFHPDPLTREFKGTLAEPGTDAPREIELPYVYDAETARQCLWFQRKLLDLRKCVMRVAVLGSDLRAGDVVNESEPLLGATAATWRVLEAQERVGVIESLMLGRQEDMSASEFCWEPPDDWPFAGWDKDIRVGNPATDWSKTPPPPVTAPELVLTSHNEDRSVCEISFSWQYSDPLENCHGVQIEVAVDQGASVIAKEIHERTGRAGSTTIEVVQCEHDAAVRILSTTLNNNLKGFPVLLNAPLALRFIHVATSSLSLSSEPSVTSISFRSNSSRTLYVKLPVAPTSTVTVTIAKTGSVSISKTSMTFTPTTWGTAQSVVLSGSAGSGTVTLTAASSDSNYQGKTTSVGVSISQYVAPLPKLDTPENVDIFIVIVWGSETIVKVFGSWDDVSNATSYVFSGTRPAGAGGSFSGTSTTSSTLLSSTPALWRGTYTLSVKAKAPGYQDSDWSPVFSYSYPVN